MSRKILAVDLFSGAGGLSLGFMQTEQVHIVTAVEINEYAQDTYRENHPGIEMQDNIKTLNYAKIKEECRKVDGEKVHLVFGGPPCQGFSNANRQKATLISTNNQLVKDYVSVIEELNPDAFVMENVKAMKSNKNKFFYSSDDDHLLKGLEIEFKDETIELGNTHSLTFELDSFIRSSLDDKQFLNGYLLDDMMLSKLSHLARKEKELTKYLNKNKSLFQKVLPKWESLHQQYFCEAYKVKWMSMKDLLAAPEESQYGEIIKLLREVNEVQRILLRVKEIIANDINVKFDVIGKHAYVKLKTYNVLDYLYAKFRKMKYVLNEPDNLIANSAHFGAPQERERLILIGVKENITKGKKVELPKPLFQNNYNTVRDAIGDIAEIEPSTDVYNDVPLSKMPSVALNSPLRKYLNGNVSVLTNHVTTVTTTEALKRFAALKEGQNFHHLDDSLKQSYSDPSRTQNSVYKRLAYDAPSGTVLNVRKSMWVHPNGKRAISIREAARLQTFPDNFKFVGSKDAQYQQIGNAVPPLLGRAVAEKVLELLGAPVAEQVGLSAIFALAPETVQ